MNQYRTFFNITKSVNYGLKYLQLRANQMRTRLIFLVLIIICFSCGKNNNPLSDAEIHKIESEVKEVVNTIYKIGEEADFEMRMAYWLDSPDFVYTSNGQTFNYKESLDRVKTLFSLLINQKSTIYDEKYVVLDNFVVLYTANTKWIMNFKDGHSVIQDPWALQILFKKTDNRWKEIYIAESGNEKIVEGSQTPNELNQVGLMNQFIGTWELIKCIAIHQDGKITFPYGENPNGQILYDTNGNMMVEIMNREIEKFNNENLFQGTPEEIIPAYNGFLAYYGTYQILADTNLIIHNIEACSFPNWVGQNQQRRFEFQDNKLILKTPQNSSVQFELTWEKLK
jgi:hypothetical protein